ncbi:MAG TPA: protoporphyrinogen oxidase [Acidimicrobiales bacterium]|nr:protoporphyrinogen oxidase [Acidimicrobiales bacterium]
MRPAVVVVGGGITGLAAAWELSRGTPSCRVVLLEAGPALGGRIRSGSVAGVEVELGPDAFLARVPHAVDLCAELGIRDELVPPAASHAYVWSRGRLRRLPPGLVLGVPSDLGALARSGIVGPAGLLRAGLDLVLPAARSEADRSVGEIVTGRFGREVHQRLVDPLVGGINAGRSELLSARSVAPQLDAAARSHRSLLLGLRGQAPPPSDQPVFLTHPDGLTHVVGTLERRLREAGVEIRTGVGVTALERRPGGWAVATGPAAGAAAGGEPLDARAVVVTTPAPVTAALLADVCPEAAAELGGIEQASVVVVTFAYRPTAFPAPPDGSGFLVPRPEGRLMTAATFLSSKWAHLARPDLVLVRVSAGRYRDDRAFRLTDAEVARALHEELAEATGLTERPVGTTVTRWPEAFPQYAVGHLDRVARIEAAVDTAPGLALAGSALRGIGIPACIAQGRQAAERVRAGLGAGAGVRA